MKKLKLIPAFIAVLLFSNFLYAENPSITEMATIMADKLDGDVKLTKSQRDDIILKASTFILKMQNANLLTSNEAKYNSCKQASDEYETFLDSILTVSQKDLRKTKNEERKTANINKNKNK